MLSILNFQIVSQFNLNSYTNIVYFLGWEFSTHEVDNSA